jgi:hypothetical protein
MVASVPWQLTSSEGHGERDDELPQLALRALQTGGARPVDPLLEPEQPRDD